VPVKSDSDDSDSQNDSTSTWQPLVSGGARGDNLSYKLVENERFKFSSVLRPYVLVDELDPEFKKDEPRLFDGYQHLTRGIALPGSAVVDSQPYYIVGVLYEPAVSRFGKISGKWASLVVSAGSTEVKKKQPGTLQVTNDKPRVFTEEEWLAVQRAKEAIAHQHATRFNMAQKDANVRVLRLTLGGSERQETLAQKKAEEHKKQLEDTKAELAALKEKMKAKKSKEKLKTNPNATNPHLAQQQHFQQRQQQPLQPVNPLIISGEEGATVLQPGQTYPQLQHQLLQPQPQQLQLLYQQQSHAQQQPFYQQQLHHQQPIYQQQPLHPQQPIYQQQQPLYQQQPLQFYQELQPPPQNFMHMHMAPQVPNMPLQQLQIQQPQLQLAQMEERIMRVLKTQQILSIMNQ
jgi:hypothetical protein